MSSKLTDEEFIRIIKDSGKPCYPLEKYNGFHNKVLFQCTNNYSHTFRATIKSVVDSKTPCPYCRGTLAFPGETDLWTTHPHIAELLLCPEDGFKYKYGSNKRVDFKCPDCGCIIRELSINDVVRNGLRCLNCSDGISYPEKFICNMLQQLGVSFVHDRTMCWSIGKRYDFYIRDMSLIIEANGLQHYKDSFTAYGGRTAKEEQDNDLLKRKLAMDNGIQHYVEINCSYSNLEFIKKSIINSELKDLFDLTNVDWNQCHVHGMRSIDMKCVDMWNDGIRNTRVISEKTGLHICTVIEKLKKARDAGLCDYETDMYKNKPLMCIETQKIYKKIEDVKQDGYYPQIISRCCRGIRDDAYGLHWKFI